MSKTFNTMPMGVCPHCEKEFQVEDYDALEAGDTRDCPSCENEIHIIEREDIIWLRFGTESAT